MKMYKIIDRKYKNDEYVDGRAISFCAIYCDTVDDLPNSEQIKKDGIGSGSWAWVAEADTFATLKIAGEWEVSSVTPESISYDSLTNKPRINNIELSGNKSLASLGIQPTLTFDSSPTENSTNPVTSGGVYTAIDAINTIIGNINTVLEGVL